jgi:hypothetical protein
MIPGLEIFTGGGAFTPDLSAKSGAQSGNASSTGQSGAVNFGGPGLPSNTVMIGLAVAVIAAVYYLKK